MLSTNGPLVAWKSRKQQTVSLSSCEAEYVSLSIAIQQGKFMQQLLNELLNVNLTIELGIDNQGALHLAKNPVHHQRSKHIDIRYHYIRDEVQKGFVNLFYIHTKCNPADIFTKPVTFSKLSQFAFIRG